MKQATIVNNYPAIQKLQECDIPFEVAYDLCRLEEEMRKIVVFQQEQHKKLMMKYKPEYNQETQELKFKNHEECKEFIQKMEELDNLEADIHTQIVRIKVDPAYGLKLKPKEIRGLQEAGLVEFYKDEIIVSMMEPVKPEDIPEGAEVLRLPVEAVTEETASEEVNSDGEVSAEQTD